MEVKKKSINWIGSAVESGVDWLVDQSKRKEFIDLSHLWIITQTSGASRRLTDALAQYANERDSACLLPKWSTPGSLIKPGAEFIDGFRVASPVQAIAHWVVVLKENDLSEYPNLFPRLPKELDVSWGLSMARALVQLREILAEVNHDCKSVEASRLAEKWLEQDRWADLARLENEYRTRLQRNGLLDPMDAGRRWVRQAMLPNGVERIVLFGVPGFPDLARGALENFSGQGACVESVVFCSCDHDLDFFDEFGRPIRTEWERRPLSLKDDQLRLVYGPAEQAGYASEILNSLTGERDEKVNVGVLDPEVKDNLIVRSREGESQFCFHDPEGTAGIQAPIYGWFKAIYELLCSGSMSSAAHLMNFSLTLQWLDANGQKSDIRKWQKELDKLHSKNLCQRLDDGILFSAKLNYSVEEPLLKLKHMITGLQSGSFEKGILSLVRQALNDRSLSRSSSEDLSFLELLPKLSDWLADLEKVSNISVQEQFSIFLGMIAKSSWTNEEQEDDVAMYGWLELPWADAPNLLVLGCNDSFLPSSLPVNSFVPQPLRSELGLWTDGDRAGRDAYLLSWVLASRKGESSSVEFVLGKFSQDGSPLKPSSLFFICNENDLDELPNRTEKLFADVVPEESNPAWAFPWKLNPGIHEPIRKISVTSFRNFLSCPFRFYLKKKFRMDEYDTEKEEADVMDFGTLTHHALEGLKDYSDSSPNEDEIYNLLCQRLAEEINKRYGKNPSLSILQQKASIERRLKRVARLHVEELMDGWRIYKVEKKFYMDSCGSRDPAEWEVLGGEDEPLKFESSIKVVGVVDRIDYHPERGVYRLYDYKTSEKGPKVLHLKKSTVRMEEYPEFFFFDQNGKTMRWMDLQLPLYKIWAEKVLLSKEVQGMEVGIYNVPAKEEKIGPNMWTELDDELVREAGICAGRVLEDLLSPTDHRPVSKVEHDTFEDLFFHSPEDAVESFLI